MNFLQKITARTKIKKKLSKLFHSSNSYKYKKKTILLEFSNWTFNHLASAYICDILSKKYKAKVVSYASFQLTSSKLKQNLLEKLLWSVGNLLSLKSFGIYHSFGVSNIFFPSVDSEIEIKATKEFLKYYKNIKSKEDVQNYKINNILFGDLIYDSYLKSTLYPTIDINSLKFKSFFLDSIKLFFFWETYFLKNSISAIVSYHSVYLGALPLRFGISKKIPSYVLNINKLYRLSESKILTGKEYLDYKKIFKKLTLTEKKKNLKIAKKKLTDRFSGALSSDLLFADKSAYRKSYSNKIFLIKSKKIKILIAPHSFSDSPHVFGNAFFPDSYVWLENLGKISNQTNYDWYIKCHPDFNIYFDNTISLVNGFVKKYPNIKYLNANTPHIKIINEGIDYVLTVYGTIAGEYPYFDVNAINATKNHTQIQYDFTTTPKNKKEYLYLLRNLKKPNKVKKKTQVLEHSYMKYEYFNNRWFFDDLKQVKQDVFGYNNLFREQMYVFFVKNFDLNSHKKRYEKIKKFSNSNNYIMINK